MFLWRCAFMRLSYLCFDIFFRRFFLIEPILFSLVEGLKQLRPLSPDAYWPVALEDDLVERQLNDARGACCAQNRNQIAHLLLLDDRLTP